MKKTCTACGFSNESDAERCFNCERPFSDSAAAAAGQGERTYAPGGSTRPTAPAPTPAPAPAPSPIVRVALDYGAERPRTSTSSAPAGERDPVDDDLREIEESGRFTIGVIGFATSGKTFFINRLKKFFRQEGGYEPKPAPPDDDAVVEGTTQIETHRFLVLETDAEREGRPGAAHFRRDREPFYMIDIPGERFRQALEADLAGAKADTLLNVLRLSHALIIVLPADDLLAPRLENSERLELRQLEREIAAMSENRATLSIEDQRKLKRMETKAKRLTARVEQESQLEKLLDNIALISALACELRDESGVKITLERYRAMSETERAAAYTGKLRGPAPFAYVALAKADKLISASQRRRVAKAHPNIAEPDLIDVDPGNVVRLHRPKIHQRIVQSFAWHKFDFVTCFEDQPADEKRIHYWLPHHGVAAVVEWIHWARIYSLQSGRRSSDGGRRFERLRSWWDRMEGGLARRLAAAHESGSRADPRKLGLLPDHYATRRGRLLDGVRATTATVIDRLMAPKGHGPRLAVLAAGALITLLSVGWLTGVFASREQRGYSFHLRPVYSAEIAQMEAGAAAFGEGLVDRRLRRWSNIPSDGGWFSFAEGGPARARLREALRLLPAEGEPGEIDRSTAEGALSNLQAAAGADRRQVRAANSYHEALLRYVSGDPDAAAATFVVARDELDRAQSEGASGARYQATASRMAAARAAIRHGLGTAELVREGGDAAVALSALREARDIVRDPDSAVRDTTALSRFWFPVTTRDPQPMIRIETSQMWTNLLAALIRTHRLALAQGEERAEPHQRELGELVTRAGEHADEASNHPRLVANLMIAAARSGNTNTIGAFFVADEVPEDARQAVAYAQLLANPDDTAHPGGRYWAITQRWRGLLAPQGGRPRAAVREIAADLERNPADRDALRLWLADVMETEFRRSSGGARRELTLNFGQYYDGPQSFRYANAYAPFGIIVGLILSALILIGFISLWVAFRRLRPTYFKLHVPQHRSQRHAASVAV